MTRRRAKELIAEKERHWQRCRDRKCFMLADRLASEIEALERVLSNK